MKQVEEEESRNRQKKGNLIGSSEQVYVHETEIISCLVNLASETRSAVDYAWRQSLIIFQRNEIVLAIQHAQGDTENTYDPILICSTSPPPHPPWPVMEGKRRERGEGETHKCHAMSVSGGADLISLLKALDLI